MARKLNKKQRIQALRNLSFIMLLVLLAATSIFVVRTLSDPAIPQSGNAINTQVQTQMPTPIPTVMPRTITISAVGDLMMHQRQLDDAKQKDGSYDFSNYFTEVAPYLSRADLTFGNLETTLLGKNYSGFPRFSAPDSYLDAIKAAGFDVLTTSNNHSFDTGFAGLLRTIETVRSYGFYQTGTYRNAEEYNTPLIIDVNGIKVGVIAYTHGVNGREKAVTPAQLSFCIRSWRTADYARDVKACRDAGADIVLVSVHWGQENERVPSREIRSASMKMLQAGVDLILGSHPHVVQPIEILDVTRNDGTTARCAVAYSMGNFMSNQRVRYTDCGIIFNITLKEDELGRFQVDSMSYVPTYVNRKPGYTGYRVLPVNEYMADKARFDKLDAYNQGRLTRAWNDLTKQLQDGPAALTTAP